MNISLDATSSAEYELMSSDELMLQELERRDGIYSFIFHELESDKTITLTPTSTVTSCAATATATSNNDHNYSATTTNTFKLRGDAKIITVCETMPYALNGLGNNTSATTTTTKTTFIASSSSKLQPSASDTLFSHTPPKLPPYYPLTAHHLNRIPPPPPPPPPHYTPPLAHTHHAWPSLTPARHTCFPPTTLYTYMTNLGLRVRKPKERFSHLSAPLVRNRQHELKNSPEYKCLCEGRIVKVPDLRALFPYDPDVHAPFCAQTPTVNDLLKANKPASMPEFF